MSLVMILGQADDRYWGHMDGWGGGWMWVWGSVMLALMAALIVWMVRATAGGVSKRDVNERAREILGERYARGELTVDEYRERIDELH